MLSRAKRDPDQLGQLSPALSHALLRLQEAGKIQLESKADAPNLRFLVGAGETVDYSHVSIASA